VQVRLNGENVEAQAARLPFRPAPGRNLDSPSRIFVPTHDGFKIPDETPRGNPPRPETRAVGARSNFTPSINDHIIVEQYNHISGNWYKVYEKRQGANRASTKVPSVPIYQGQFTPRFRVTNVTRGFTVRDTNLSRVTTYGNQRRVFVNFELNPGNQPKPGGNFSGSHDLVISIDRRALLGPQAIPPPSRGPGRPTPPNRPQQPDIVLPNRPAPSSPAQTGNNLASVAIDSANTTLQRAIRTVRSGRQNGTAAISFTDITSRQIQFATRSVIQLDRSGNLNSATRNEFLSLIRSYNANYQRALVLDRDYLSTTLRNAGYPPLNLQQFQNLRARADNAPLNRGIFSPSEIRNKLLSSIALGEVTHEFFDQDFASQQNIRNGALSRLLGTGNNNRVFSDFIQDRRDAIIANHGYLQDRPTASVSKGIIDQQIRSQTNFIALNHAANIVRNSGGQLAGVQEVRSVSNSIRTIRSAFSGFEASNDVARQSNIRIPAGSLNRPYVPRPFDGDGAARGTTINVSPPGRGFSFPPPHEPQPWELFENRLSALDLFAMGSAFVPAPNPIVGGALAFIKIPLNVIAITNRLFSYDELPWGRDQTFSFRTYNGREQAI